MKTIKPIPKPPESKKEDPPTVSSIKPQNETHSTSSTFSENLKLGKWFYSFRWKNNSLEISYLFFWIVVLEKSELKSEHKQDYQRYNLSELETEVIDAVKQAVVAYNAAVANLKGEYSTRIKKKFDIVWNSNGIIEAFGTKFMLVNDMVILCFVNYRVWIYYLFVLTFCFH